MSKIDYQALREIAKHQRLTEESASYARTNHSLILDEACSFLKISRPTTGFAPIFPDICYHLTHYKPAAADIPV
ncbi:hypothetical protein AB7X75_23990, partial [Escherichia coli]